jgi:long-chain fatty acid transport protein
MLGNVEIAKTRARNLVWSLLLAVEITLLMRIISHIGRFSSAVIFAALGALACSRAQAGGLYRDGVSASSMGMGGTTTAAGSGPSDALFSNPAELSLSQRPTLELSADGGFVHGDFSNRANNDNVMNNAGALGSGAFVLPAGPLRFALGIDPDMASRANWRYRDAPGGADGATTYGVQSQESQIMLLRTSLGMSLQVTSTLSIGASVNLLYNTNDLNAPYVFQSQPVLRTAKTLLDLNTNGYGCNVEGGFLWKPIPTLSLGASYTSGARIVSTGTAFGNANVQFANLGLGAAPSGFDYKAQVVNEFPQQVSAGIGWQATPKLLLSAQMDWINWSSSFSTLRVHLTNGTNPAINGLLGSSTLDDNVPLDWKDQFVWRFGAEYKLNDHWTVRGGYIFSENPVPSSTLTPLTAAITEHTLTAGIGYRTGPWKIDLAYQWAIPNTIHVGQSDLVSGEYSNSSVRVTEQWIGLTTTIEF